MTFAQLQAETVRRLEETTTGVFWTAEDVVDALNDGYAEITDATEWNEIWQTIDLLGDRPWYDGRFVLGEDLLTLGPAYDETSSRWLIPTRIADLDANDRRWERAVGSPQRILTRGLWWLGFWPRIGSATGTVKQYYTALAAVLSDDTDEPGFPETFHYGLVEYAVYDLTAQAGETQQALEGWARYLGYEAELADFMLGRLRDPRVQGHGPH